MGVSSLRVPTPMCPTGTTQPGISSTNSHTQYQYQLQPWTGLQYSLPYIESYLALDWQTVLTPIHRVLPSHGLVGHPPIRTTLNILLSRTLTHHVYKHMSRAGRMAIRLERATPVQVIRFSPLQPKCPGARDGDSHVETTSITILITTIKGSAFPERNA